jgi:hypothetical protein
MTAKIFYYVPKPRVQEFADLGWISHGSLEGTHHGQHSMLMEWTRDDTPIMPPAADHRSEAEDMEPGP